MMVIICEGCGRSCINAYTISVYHHHIDQHPHSIAGGEDRRYDICPECAKKMVDEWSEKISASIEKARHSVPLPQVKTEEPEVEVIIPAKEEPETVCTEPDDDEETTRIPEEYDFDSLDDAVLDFLSERASASVSQIAEHIGASKHDTVCILERLRRKGQTAKAAGRYMWRVIA